MLLKISQLAAQSGNWKRKIDQIIQVTRPWFVFDNFVIYVAEKPGASLEVTYAKATGRGKFSGAEISWGESTALQAIAEEKTILEFPVNSNEKDRLNTPTLIGLFLPISKAVKGALVLIRFGGPEFLEEGVHYAEFLSSQVLSIIRQAYLEDVSSKLHDQYNHAHLQEDFLNTISHELRSPLGFIKGYTTTLLREDTVWDQVTQRDFLEIIERESNNLGHLIDDLLDSSRLQSGQLPLDFHDISIEILIRNEVSRATIANPDLQVVFDFANKLPLINGDARRLAQVFDNLLSNSNKYAPGANIYFTVKCEDDKMVILFKDDGPGIKSRYLPKVFTRFFRDPDNAGKARGSGLGLSICKQIIELHKGEMSVSSPQGSGAVFKIVLPIGSEQGGV